MANTQGELRPSLEVQTVGTITVSKGILYVPVNVYVHQSIDSEGEAVLIFGIDAAESLFGKFHSRIPEAKRQIGRT
jgi:hypothetical protein